MGLDKMTLDEMPLDIMDVDEMTMDKVTLDDMPLDKMTCYHTFSSNGTVHFRKCKQLLEYQHLLLLRDIWCSKLLYILKCSSFFLP
jgi:hypothetical protein